jgi:hypothetical protein
MAPDEQPPVEPEHHPSPTIWPIGFAIGIVVVLLGLVINPLVISTIGGAIVVVFGFLWIVAATKELRRKRSRSSPSAASRRSPARPRSSSRFPARSASRGTSSSRLRRSGSVRRSAAW